MSDEKMLDAKSKQKKIVGASGERITMLRAPSGACRRCNGCSRRRHRLHESANGWECYSCRACNRIALAETCARERR